MTLLDQIRRARSRLDREFPARAPESVVCAREALFSAEGEVYRLQQLVASLTRQLAEFREEN